MSSDISTDQCLPNATEQENPVNIFKAILGHPAATVEDRYAVICRWTALDHSRVSQEYVAARAKKAAKESNANR